MATHEEAGLDADHDFFTWWATDRQLWWRDIDELGHLTAARYADLYQEACGDFVVEAWQAADSDYVVARTEIVYLREVRLVDSPVKVFVRASMVGRASFALSMVLTTANGRPCSTSRGVYVAWDRATRGARTLTPIERARLNELGRSRGSGNG